MRSALRMSLLVMAVLALAAPASAHESASATEWLLGESAHHPGWYWPSPESQTQNVKLLGSVSRTRADSTYRNSDLAFWGDRAYAGHYDGFQIVDISAPENPSSWSTSAAPDRSTTCRSGRTCCSCRSRRRARAACTATRRPQSPGFEGIRIFDVSNPRAPELIKGVPTDCGSHTHTLVPDAENGRVLLYVASYTASEIPVSSTATRACASTRTASVTTRSPSSRCRWATRPARAS